jgi:HAE1 family hydrophobic/amphiphilic exporter-1
MDATMRAVEDELRQVAGVRTLLTTVGSGGLSRANSGQVYVRLDDIASRRFSLARLWRETLAGRPSAAMEGNFTQREVMQQVRRRLARFKDLDVSVRNLTSFRQGAPVDIDFSIIGPDLDALASYSSQLIEKMQGNPQKGIEGIPGIVDCYNTLRMDKPEMHVAIDRELAASLGVDVAEIATTLRLAIGGDDRVSRWRDYQLDDVYDVELRLVGLDRGTRESISQLYVRARPGQDPGSNAASPSGGSDTSAGSDDSGRPTLTRLDNVVRVDTAKSPARIDRIDRQRTAAVRANVAPGYALADRIEALRKAADELGMPPSYTTRVLGRGRELERTLRDFRWTFVLSFIFMYIILAMQFEHVVHPLTILFTLPLAVPFGLVSLWLGGETLNLYSALGILVLFGVIKKNAILQVDLTNRLRARGMDRPAAILQANRDRLRPILMTTIAFVAGMLPLLVGTGPGAEERRSIAVLVAGGQTLSLLLTLLAVPVVYSFLDDIGRLLSRKRAVPAAAREEALAPVAADGDWEDNGVGATVAAARKQQ